jgi:hypothetical protein
MPHLPDSCSKRNLHLESAVLHSVSEPSAGRYPLEMVARECRRAPSESSLQGCALIRIALHILGGGLFVTDARLERRRLG